MGLADGRLRMLLGPGPIKVRIEGEGEEAEALLAEAEERGLVLAAPGEIADLIASPAMSSLPRPPMARAESALKQEPALSPRELEILDYLVDGWSNAEIASALRIGVRTVRFHLEGLYGRLGVSRRGEAVREAVRLGFVRFDA
jgi:DNA-binding CsgD family transcriptional regulator